MWLFPGNSSRSEPALLSLYLFLCYASLVVSSVLFLMMHIISALLLFWFCLDFQLYRGGQFYWWRSVLLVEVSFIGGGNRRTRKIPPTCHKSLTNFIKLFIMLFTSPLSSFELTTSVVIGTDCIGNCKSNCHTITATTTPPFVFGISGFSQRPIISTIFLLFNIC